MLFRIWAPPAAPAFPAASELSIPCRDAAGRPMKLGLGDEILAGHLLLTGGTGTGKTCFLKALSERCRSAFPDANFVFLDPKGDFWPARRCGDQRVTFDPGEDVFQWNILDEALAAARPEEELDEIIQKLFAPMIQSAGANRFFIQAASQVFYGYLLTALRRCRGGSVPTHRELAAWLSQSTLARLRDRLAMETDLAGIRTCLEGREAAAVAAELHQFAHTFFCTPGEGHETIAGFLARRGQALFLEYDAARAESSKPLLRLLLDRAISAILSSRWDSHRVFFFLDEASVLTDYGLERLLNIGRSRGPGWWPLSRTTTRFSVCTPKAPRWRPTLRTCWPAFPASSPSAPTPRPRRRSSGTSWARWTSSSWPSASPAGTRLTAPWCGTAPSPPGSCLPSARARPWSACGVAPRSRSTFPFLTRSNAMTTDLSFPVSSGGWICSGQDAAVRRALLQAAWRRPLPGACRVVVAAAECLPEVQALAAKSGTALHLFPSADQAYFPVFSPPDNQQRIGRLIELMRLWGWDELLLGKVYAYLDLLLELDSQRQGRPARLDLACIGRYRWILAVERTLDQMLGLSRDQRRRFLEAYAECTAAGPALENFLRMLQPVCSLGQPAGGSAARLPAGTVAVFPVRTMMEEKHRQCLLRLLAFDLADASRPIQLTILEGTQKWGPELPLLIHQSHELGGPSSLYIAMTCFLAIRRSGWPRWRPSFHRKFSPATG